MRTLLVSFILLITTTRLFAQEFVVFNDVWTGTGSSSAISLDNISQVSGIGFRLFSIGSTFPTSGTDVPSKLTYSNSGILYSYTGVVKGKFVSNGQGNPTNALYFLANDNITAFALVLPLREGQMVVGDDLQGNSSGIVADVNSIKSSQSASIIINIDNAASQIESSSEYSYFTLTFSKNRSAISKTISLTPSLINSTAVSGSDFSSSIEYRKNLSDSWVSATSGFSVGSTENTIYFRVPLLNDQTPECQEQFFLQTGLLTGDGSLEVQNFEGVYGTAKISDDNDPLTWTGTTNSDWDVSSNYDLSLAPDSCYCITLPSSPSGGRDPLISSTSTKNTLKNLTINSGGKISIGSGATLKVIGDVTINNAVDGVTGEGTLELNGTTSQTISGNGLVKNIKINNASGVTISSGNNKLNVLGLLTTTSTSGKITTNGNLVLKATETEEGMIGELLNCSATSNNPILGDVTVERFIPVSKRAFRFLTPGVTTSTKIRGNWQEGANITDPNDYPHTTAVVGKNPNPGYGTHITGSQTGQNGFDATITGNPSVFQFNALTQQWGEIPDTDQKELIVGEGYQIMIRGDRSRDLRINTPPHNATIIRATGTPATCSYTFNSTTSIVPLGDANNEYSFIGNPFWSLVNWRAVTKNNVSNTFYYWDPMISGSNNRGGYVTLQSNTDSEADDVKTPQAGANTNSSVNRYIQPGQGFFVQNTGLSPSVIFEEADKVSDKTKKAGIFAKNPTTAGGEIGMIDQARVRTSTKVEKVYLSLYLKQNLSIGPADGLALTYSNKFSDAIGNEDASKFYNLDENISFLKDARRYAILGMNNTAFQKSDTIPLYMWNLGNKEYVLRIDLRDYIEPTREVFILNKTTGESTKIEKNTFFDFTFQPSIGVTTDDKLAIIFNTSPIKSQKRSRNSLTVSPNPISNSELKITIPDDEISLSNNKTLSSVEIINAQGFVLKRYSPQINSNNSISLNVEDLPFGVYTIKTLIDGKTYFNKIIKQ